eukprot:TRINITY_DN3748_c1_g5_i1.p1 TRINITY_DN3748_c1_g5~~TRINITY_DN3748_c1_g5_i1.p1  ORF type:complete len:273 (-),score=97.10 TRINITY_DN3748_c1_g5_i1:135-953(-)
MARNEEKAQSMLNRFLQLKAEEKRKPKERRPYLASECHNLPECEKWRSQILRDVGKKVTEIQNASLGEYRLRELNDEINKLIREKSHWEKRILELGGPNYAATQPKILDANGAVVPGGNRDYKYFGEAKNLPGVKELFRNDAPAVVRKTRHELSQKIDPDYYGFRDDDDDLLIPFEAEAEQKAIAKAVNEWKKKRKQRDKETILLKGKKGKTSQLNDHDDGDGDGGDDGDGVQVQDDHDDHDDDDDDDEIITKEASDEEDNSKFCLTCSSSF